MKRLTQKINPAAREGINLAAGAREKERNTALPTDPVPHAFLYEFSDR